MSQRRVVLGHIRLVRDVVEKEIVYKGGLDGLRVKDPYERHLRGTVLDISYSY